MFGNNKFRLTNHAISQCAQRNIPEEQVKRIFSDKRNIILQKLQTCDEVRVVVGYTAWQTCPDGSTGDTIVACVGKDRNIRTIMLRGSNQIRQSQRYNGVRGHESVEWVE